MYLVHKKILLEKIQETFLDSLQIEDLFSNFRIMVIRKVFTKNPKIKRVT